MENETQKALIEEYKKLQFQLQISMAGGASPDPAELERLQKILDMLNDLDDVSEVYHNANLPEKEEED